MRKKPKRSAFKTYIYEHSPTIQSGARSYSALLKHGINTFSKFEALDMEEGDFFKMWRGVGKATGNNLDNLKKLVHLMYTMNKKGEKDHHEH